MVLSELIKQTLSEIIHPEYNSDIVSLDIISNVDIQGNKIRITTIFPKKIDPVKKRVLAIATQKLKNKPELDSYEISFIDTAPKKNVIIKDIDNNFHKIIAISSGKGGVGKSTITSNIAVSISKLGYKVAILDADIFGPSIPKMFGLSGLICETKLIEGKHYIVPFEKHGVKIMSIGLLIKEEDPVIWRGPMASKALKQIIFDTLWGDVDFLIIDLPPGTSDIHLSVTQFLKIDSAVIVTTPQQVALLDTIKGINMFKQKDIQIPIIGIIENMAWFVPNDNLTKKYFVFGKGNVEIISEKINLPIIGKIPLFENISNNSDIGTPISLNDENPESAYYKDIAKIIIN